MKYQIPLIIISMFLLIGAGGCNQQSATGLSIREFPEENIQEEIPQEIVCNFPYIRHADDCCLDKNSNDICDSDETIIPEPQPSTDVADSCSDTTYFDCWGSYITKDEIFLKLKAKRDGYNVIRKVEFPSINCEKEFDPIPREQGLEIRESIEIKIPCKISTTSFKDLSYEVSLIYYPASGDTTEWLDVGRGLIKNSGTLSGSVRDSPPETI